MQLLKIFLQGLLKLLYRVEVHGIEHAAAAGKRVMVVANHTSFLDGMLLAVYLPDRLTFAVNTKIATRWWARPFLTLVDFFAMDPTNAMSLKSFIAYLKQDHKVVIFPEGRITVTGSLMKIYQGPGMVAEKSGAMVLPVRIEGAQYTPFSRLRGRVRRRWFPKIRLTVLPPSRIEVDAHVSGHERRQQAGKILADMMSDMMFTTSDYQRTLYDALLDASRTHGRRRIILEDIRREPVDYQTVILRSCILGRHVVKDAEAGDVVGILLPNMAGTVMTFLALQLYGRVPAMLNCSAGVRAIAAAVETAKIRVVYTSRLFVDAAKMEPVIERLEALNIKIRYLDDLRREISTWTKLLGWLAASMPRLYHRRVGGRRKPTDPAVVLFTSGSEGLPKGVVLSHQNLLANREQMAARIDFGPMDVIFNSLPMFHSFGLMAATLLPLFSGIKIFMYPSPLHYRVIPELCYDIGATILFGTNTFLAGYAKYAHPYDFYNLRYVFAGAEKVSSKTRRQWSEKFGLRILEGYGATETSPVLAGNTSMAYRAGSVGRLFPGIEYRLKEVPGIPQGRRLHVRGPNVMLGYYLHDQPGVLQPPRSEEGEGWYDTGDIVEIDEDGFVYIVGRAKRFAKIGGEMVSLATAEELAASVWPDALHAVVTVADAQKGEQLVLVTNQADAKPKLLLKQAKSAGTPELFVPRRIVHVDTMPLLGSGKIDYPAVQELAAGKRPGGALAKVLA